MLWQRQDRSEQPDRLFHWDPWVRSFLTAQELIQAFDFKPSRHADGAGGTVPGLTLRAYASHGGELGTEAHPLVTLIAPPRRVFEAQIPQVLDWAELREERLPEILAQISQEHSFWGMLVPIQTERLKRTRELIEAAVRVAVFVEMRFKHALAGWRPVDFSAQVQPLIDTPGHATLPSGHCTESYVVYELLKELLNSSTRSAKGDPGRTALNRQFRHLAERISVNRVVAGLHFPVDNVAGRLLGVTLGRHIARRCSAGATGAVHHATFDGCRFTGLDTFDPPVQRLLPDDEDALDPGSEPPPFYRVANQPLPAMDGSANDILAPLWKAALAEVSGLGLRFP